MDIKKLCRPAALLIYRVSIVVTGYIELLIFPNSLWSGLIAGFIFMFFLLYNLPGICRLNNKLLLFMSTIFLIYFIFFYNAFANSSIVNLPTINNVLSDFVIFLIIFVFPLASTRLDKGVVKKIRVDLKSEKLKRPIENISDVENILLKVTLYSVTISRTNSTVQVKIFDTISEKWIDIVGKLENNVLEVTQTESLLKIICYRILNSVRADFIIEFAPVISNKSTYAG